MPDMHQGPPMTAREPQPVCVLCRSVISLEEIPLCRQCRQDNPIASAMTGKGQGEKQGPTEKPRHWPKNPSYWSAYKPVRRPYVCSECAHLVTVKPHNCYGPVGQ